MLRSHPPHSLARRQCDAPHARLRRQWPSRALIWTWLAAVAAVLVTPSCEPSGLTLTVRIQSGIRAGQEAEHAEVRLYPGTTACPGDAPPAEVRGLALETSQQDQLARGLLTAAELGGLRPGIYTVHARLRGGRTRAGAPRDAGVVLAERCIVLSLSSDRVLRVPLTTDCVGVSCPATDGTPEFDQCLQGRCVDPRCDLDDPATSELCCDRALLGSVCDAPAPCQAASDCAPTLGCAGTPTCEGSVCIEPAEDRCGEGEYCSARTGGCEPAVQWADAGLARDAAAGGPDAAQALDAADVTSSPCATCDPLHASCDGTRCTCDPGFAGDGRTCDPVLWGRLDAFVKAGNPGRDDQFGFDVALSADGTVLAVSAVHEGTGAGGIDPVPDESAPGSGAVYVFHRGATGWELEAFIKPDDPRAAPEFGFDIALSDDGRTLAVGSYAEGRSGVVHTYRRLATDWVPDSVIDPPDLVGARFGSSVSLNADGSTLAIGASLEGSAAVGVDSPPAGSAGGSGAVYVYRRTGITWTREAFIKASNTGPTDAFGLTTALSDDGSVLAVGAWLEDGSGTGVDPASDEGARDSGAAYVYRRVGGAWQFDAYLKATNPGPDDRFGWRVAVSGDGDTLAVGAYLEDGSAAGIDGAALFGSGGGVEGRGASGGGSALSFALRSAAAFISSTARPSAF